MIKGKPNLFFIATKELAQDGILTWLLQWASPTMAELNRDLHRCGFALLTFLMDGAEGFDSSLVTSVWAERQWEKIDITVEIEYSDGRNSLLIIEDKTFAGEHGNQLNRYKLKAQEWCDAEGYELSCAFIKIGGETRTVLEEIRAKGFRVFDRPGLIQCLAPFRKGNDSAIDEFLDYLEFVEEEYQSFQQLPLSQWTSRSWIGFYQLVESIIEVGKWHYVDNASGGFWNLLLNWEYWHEFPVYIQIQEGHLCYKVAIEEGESGVGQGVVDVNKVQDFLLAILLNVARQEGYSAVRRPYRLVHKGRWRSFAMVPREDWLGKGNELLDQERVIESLRFQLAFFYRYKKSLDAISFREAGVLLSPKAL